MKLSVWWMGMAAAFGAAALGAADLPLHFESSQLEPRYKARLEAGADGVKLASDTAEWDSGLRINPPKGKKFDFSQGRYLAVDVENCSDTRQMRLTMHITSGQRGQASDSHVNLPLREVNTGIGLNPGEKRTMRLYLPHARLFTSPENGKNLRRPLDTAQINSIEFKMQWPFEAGFKNLLNCRLSNFRLEGEPETDRAVNAQTYFPFIDSYGQYRHSDWPEKIHADADLPREHARELAELERTPAPATWNQYGGWASGPQRKATGSFRVEKYNGKWFFVDPEGKLFWSFGIDVLRANTDTINGRKHEAWFADKLPADGLMPFTPWNLEKKYGKADYLNDFYSVLERRMRSWGINSIGNWGSPDLILRGKMPYTLTLGEMIKNVPRLGKYKFYDVFAPEFEAKVGNLLRDRAAVDPSVAKSLTDPMCIGYFIDNELQFGNIQRGVMEGNAKQPAKQELARRMQQKYGEIAKLNEAWETQYADWAKFADSNTIPKGKNFRKDFDEFQRDFLRRYFETCRKAIKNVAPQRLYLGCRFVGFRQAGIVWENAAKFCDVVSVNTYSNSVYNTNRGDFRDRPILIGEFHFGTYDRGMFSASLAPVGDQKERGVSLTRFIQGALAHPNFVGAHYFQFRDQPLTGRYDGEGYQIGFVDCADTPYPEMTRAARELGENMYQYRIDGKLNNNMK